MMLTIQTDYHRLYGISTTEKNWPLQLLKLDHLISQLDHLKLKNPNIYFWKNEQGHFLLRSIYFTKELSLYEKQILVPMASLMMLVDAKLINPLNSTSEKIVNFLDLGVWVVENYLQYHVGLKGVLLQIDEIKRIDDIYLV